MTRYSRVNWSINKLNVDYYSTCKLISNGTWFTVATTFSWPSSVFRSLNLTANTRQHGLVERSSWMGGLAIGDYRHSKSKPKLNLSFSSGGGGGAKGRARGAAGHGEHTI